MNKIQLITNRNFKTGENMDLIVSNFSVPQTIDLFDVNIVDLSYDGIWMSKEYELTKTTLNIMTDIVSVSKMIHSSHNNVIVVLPQNDKYQYMYRMNGNRSSSYEKSVPIKDIISPIQKNILCLFDKLFIKDVLLYENSKTILDDIEYKAAFVFQFDNDEIKTVTVAQGSCKPTTILVDNRMYVTTLDIVSNPDSIIHYLRHLNLVTYSTAVYPQWLKDYTILDDEVNRKVIEDEMEIIKRAQIIIDDSQKRLNANLRYKSILITNGSELVDTVFEMLSIMLDCDLSHFVDKKKEDFLIRCDDITFIGEIKGVTSNVKFEHVAQVDWNCQHYRDELVEESKNEIVKELLIINHSRNKPLSERLPIHKDQIDLAKRNNALIITSESFLKMFEMYKNGELSRLEIKKCLIEQTGELILTQDKTAKEANN